MLRERFTIIKHNRIAKDVFQLELSGDVSQISAPGQFVNLQIPGFYLRRPISICDWTIDNNAKESRLLLIYKVVGEGTNKLSQSAIGQELELLLPLGTGFDVSKTTSNTVLCGGGVGVPPLVGLARQMIAEGKTPQVLLGFNSKEDIFGLTLFQELGIEPLVTTVDGSQGTKGFVTDVLKNLTFDYICCCGPEGMLKAIHDFSLLNPKEASKDISTKNQSLRTQNTVDGQFSLEARMACGFGACMGCSKKTKTGYKRICKEGPVFEKSELIWEVAR
ncbi:dihydroorotate dehydrogenase electron transfer subunit [Streptococcus zalophi]|uniref:dihydroorotate dehydrogenase electron transfer subunit n=1 Tax=Streptococcus zalophi TaxID=640031 RepID=UPI00215B8ADE|nr:dihydroorotate dehydrogenase electron transfer subunit [Streptococcus zalophi]MCR8967551.1 dihydroorotate dehydrogenase electron transfer subunit [Streptococcus zalophi]